MNHANALTYSDDELESLDFQVECPLCHASQSASESVVEVSLNYLHHECRDEHCHGKWQEYLADDSIDPVY